MKTETLREGTVMHAHQDRTQPDAGPYGFLEHLIANIAREPVRPLCKPLRRLLRRDSRR